MATSARSVMLLQGPKEGIEDALAGAGIDDHLALPKVVHEEDED